MSLKMNKDYVLRDRMEETTSSLPRGTSTWTQCYGNATNVIGRQSRMKDGDNTDPGNATSYPVGLRKSQELNVLSFMVLMVATSCDSGHLGFREYRHSSKQFWSLI